MVCRTLLDVVEPSLLLHTSCLCVFRQSFEVPTPSEAGLAAAPQRCASFPLDPLRYGQLSSRTYDANEPDYRLL